MLFGFLRRNKFIGYLIGKYNIESESKRILNSNEKFVSGVELVQFNESIYILSVIYLLLVSLLTVFISNYLFVLIIGFPIILLFSNELELDILTNERIILVKRTIMERFMRITNESSVALDDIVLVKFGRAPFNKNALYFSIIGYLSLLFIIIVQIYYKIDLLIETPFIVVTFLIFLYLTWIGLRLSKRSLELSIIGVANPIGIGRTKGVPLWFIYEIQTLVFDSLPSNLKKISPDDYKRVVSDLLIPVKELVDRTPIELHKKVIIAISEKEVDITDLYKILENAYQKSEINKAFKELRKKKFIYFNRKTNKWSLNRYRNVGLVK